METRQLSDENEATRNELGFKNGKSWPTDVSNGGKAGGLSSWWTDEVRVLVMTRSQHHIDAKVVHTLAGEWRFTGLYGWPEGSEKECTWQLLRQLAAQWGGAWLCGGDLNQVLSDSENKGGNPPVEAEIQEFADCLVDVGLQDLGFTGYSIPGRIGGCKVVTLRNVWIDFLLMRGGVKVGLKHESLISIAPYPIIVQFCVRRWGRRTSKLNGVGHFVLNRTG
ncbi:unnamed protein product [Linum trigynum]|uniref:Uncharacterized protein n=1 Tax=Linum trigynum TaxID=586398 RepID=A0AAV2CAG7_9ROSI